MAKNVTAVAEKIISPASVEGLASSNTRNITGFPETAGHGQRPALMCTAAQDPTAEARKYCLGSTFNRTGREDHCWETEITALPNIAHSKDNITLDTKVQNG